MLNRQLVTGEFDEDLYEDLFEDLYEDVGAVTRNGELRDFDCQDYPNAQALRSALDDKEQRIHSALSQLQRELEGDLRELGRKRDEKIRQAGSDAQDQTEALVEEYLESLEEEGTPFLFAPAVLEREKQRLRKCRGVVDLNEHMSKKAELERQADEQETRIAEIENRVQTDLVEAKAAICEEFAEKERALREAASKTRDHLEDRLKAVEAYCRGRKDALKEMERADSPEINALTKGVVLHNARYLSRAEKRDWITRAEIEALRWFQLEYWWGWRGALVLAGAILLVVLTWASWPQRGAGELFGRMIGIVVVLIVPLAPIAFILFRAVRALARKQETE